MRPLDRFKSLVEVILPWYDPAEETKRNARTEAIRQTSIAARISSEPVLKEYKQADTRLPRRRRG